MSLNKYPGHVLRKLRAERGVGVMKPPRFVCILDESDKTDTAFYKVAFYPLSRSWKSVWKALKKEYPTFQNKKVYSRSFDGEILSIVAE